MFTPPPSPNPPVRQASLTEPDTSVSGGPQTGYHNIEDTPRLLLKQRLYRSVWTIILVPLTLMLLAAFTRFWAHPAIFDLLSTDHNHEGMKWTKLTDWSLHEPHKPLGNRLVKRSTSTMLAATNATPTVPVNPVLPTPFPQPFDTTLSANFSTTSCYDFFLNMTSADAFLSCRPFSLLVSTSLAFEEAQNNISLLNADIWGTCNTDLSQAQCDANMSWFISSLETLCQIDLAKQVQTAVRALNALHAYDLMRNTACQVDPATNAYCYVEAVANSDPSNYWFYQLPLGQPLGPNITESACNECTSGLMASYASALNGTNATNLSGLAQTYNTAADTLNDVCGSVYAKEVQVSNSSRMNTGASTMSSLVALGVLMVLVAVL